LTRAVKKIYNVYAVPQPERCYISVTSTLSFLEVATFSFLENLSQQSMFIHLNTFLLQLIFERRTKICQYIPVLVNIKQKQDILYEDVSAFLHVHPAYFVKYSSKEKTVSNNSCREK
jgi:hypothetical protein